MVIIITGNTHTGKTYISQKLLEKYHFPYISIDWLKMGLIHSTKAKMDVYDDDFITDVVWPIIVGMIKTAIENEQDLIIEGCNVVGNWRDYFADEYLSNIRFVCLVMTKKYIEDNFDDILRFEDVVGKRKIKADYTKEGLVKGNVKQLSTCFENDLDYVLIDGDYGEVLPEVEKVLFNKQK